MREENINKRIKWIDFLKGIGIISVVFLHCCGKTNRYDAILKWITSFHMFLFFFISGYLTNFNKVSNFKEFVKGKTKSLVIPYVIWGGIIGSGFEILRRYTRGIELNIKEMIIDHLFIYTNFSATWFLISLFTVYIIEYFILTKIKDKRLKALVNAIIWIIGFLLPIQINHLARIKTSLVCCAFFYIGNILKDKLLVNNNKKQIINSTALMIIGTILVSFNEKVSAVAGRFGNPILCLLGGTTIIISLVRLW